MHSILVFLLPIVEHPYFDALAIVPESQLYHAGIISFSPPFVFDLHTPVPLQRDYRSMSYSELLLSFMHGIHGTSPEAKQLVHSWKFRKQDVHVMRIQFPPQFVT